MSKLFERAAAAIDGPARVAASLIRRDGGTQMRSQLNPLTVSEYAEVMRANQLYEPFPSISVYFDGTDYWLADGFHRTEGAISAFGIDFEIPADIRPGTRRDAILHAAGANADHGLRRSVQDKARAVEALLNDEEWGQWSDREIARRCNVSHTMVQSYRKPVITGRVASELSTQPPPPVTGNSASERKYMTKHGTESVMKINRKPAVTGNSASEPESRGILSVEPTGEFPQSVEIRLINDFASQENERSRLRHIFQQVIDNLGAYSTFTGDDTTRTLLVMSAMVKRLELMEKKP